MIIYVNYRRNSPFISIYDGQNVPFLVEIPKIQIAVTNLACVVDRVNEKPADWPQMPIND
jgi:hypothetical protein